MHMQWFRLPARPWAALMLALFALAGCGDDDSSTTAICRPADDTTGTLYELLDQSVLISVPEPSGSKPNPEALSGTFRLQPFPPGPNIQLAFELHSLRVCSGADVVIESVGAGDTLGFFGNPGPLIPGTFEGSVNGQDPILFDGRGPYHFDTDGSVVLDGVIFCAPPIPPARCESFPTGAETGFYLKVFAAPKRLAALP